MLYSLISKSILDQTGPLLWQHRKILGNDEGICVLEKEKELKCRLRIIDNTIAMVMLLRLGMEVKLNSLNCWCMYVYSNVFTLTIMSKGFKVIDNIYSSWWRTGTTLLEEMDISTPYTTIVYLACMFPTATHKMFLLTKQLNLLSFGRYTELPRTTAYKSWSNNGPHSQTVRTFDAQIWDSSTCSDLNVMVLCEKT